MQTVSEPKTTKLEKIIINYITLFQCAASEGQIIIRFNDKTKSLK